MTIFTPLPSTLFLTLPLNSLFLTSPPKAIPLKETTLSPEVTINRQEQPRKKVGCGDKKKKIIFFLFLSLLIVREKNLRFTNHKLKTT